MLWQVIKPPESGLYWLNEVHQQFYTDLFAGNEFENCFDNRFKPVLAGSAKTQSYFRAVFDQYTQLDELEKTTFEAVYNNHITYQIFFSDSSLSISRLPDPDPDPDRLTTLWSAAKTLGGYLYSTTMGLACFTDAAGGTPSMDRHYKAYKELNGNVCCFCGTEEMMEERNVKSDDGEVQWRASYDHYLPKKHYPFLAVDFDNLIPCCQKCNEKAKGERDVLEQGSNRRLAFNPYVDPIGASVVANYDREGINNVMSVTIEGTGCSLEEKANTWNDTFAVLNRVNCRLKAFDASWLAPTLNGCADFVEARGAIQREISRCENSVKHEREAYFKALCFGEVVTKTDAQISDLLRTVDQIYAGRAISRG
ncbi:Uncharacterised protein [BD1-7 clade bacterium]|uniref:HNH nuclease domain-containing protein n=1 Tax=BD1-7 clade bacterium TaxID=2029982 RepID=A0A5S9PCV6_9GAMM|nr:Uncharacterised protein [BD1-7 clade bacterium]CAA0101550.1 Uncharacterised protein [BD1-7 clade bacterium]